MMETVTSIFSFVHRWLRDDHWTSNMTETITVKNVGMYNVYCIMTGQRSLYSRLYTLGVQDDDMTRAS
jgi:hypothetical protein